MATKARIFVVEDHETTARALKMLLETQGYDVAVAHGVSSALKHADREPFDLLVCDISLPDGTGWDLMKKLSAKKPVRGIAFTASGSDEDISRSRAVGFMEHVVKGSDAEDLLRVVKQALNEHHSPKPPPARAKR